MAEYLDVFTAVLVFSFGLFTLMSGLFTAYFGAGRSRAIGFTLSVVGIIGLVLFAALTWDVITLVPSVFPRDQVVIGLVGVLGAAVGAVAALLAFLLSIMKA